MLNLRGQLVGNFQLSLSVLSLIGYSHGLGSSSETLRENLKHLNVHMPKHKFPGKDEDFGFYLAG
jgi:hypothetical protein